MLNLLVRIAIAFLARFTQRICGLPSSSCGLCLSAMASFAVLAFPPASFRRSSLRIGVCLQTLHHAQMVSGARIDQEQYHHVPEDRDAGCKSLSSDSFRSFAAHFTCPAVAVAIISSSNPPTCTTCIPASSNLFLPSLTPTNVSGSQTPT